MDIHFASKPFLELSSYYIVKALGEAFLVTFQDSYSSQVTSQAAYLTSFIDQDTYLFQGSYSQQDSMPFHLQAPISWDTKDTVRCSLAISYNSQDCMPYYKINFIA